TPFTTGENLQKQSDLHQLDDGVQVKTKVPTENTPHTFDNSLYNTDGGVHVYQKSQVPEYSPSLTPHDQTTTTPSGNAGTPSTTTPGGDDGTPTTTTPGGNDGTPTTTTPGGNDGTPTTTTPGAGDGTPTTTTPGGNDGTPTTITPGGNDGTPTTITPGGNDGTPTTTPGGDDGTPTPNTDTTNTTTVSQTPITTGTPTSTTATTPTRTGNGLTGQTPTTDTTTVNSDGTTRRTLSYVDATKAPTKAAPAVSDNAQSFNASKPHTIPDQTAIIADQTNAPSPDDPAESAPVVANVIDENAILTHGNIFTAGGAPGMADYTFFSQPVMDTATNSVDHYELLLRVWDSKQGGWHLPASFSIPASMEAHLMARAVAQLDVKDISINLTDTQFEDPDTQKAITDLAQSDAVDNLTIELATIPDNDQLEANAKVFQKAGIAVTLDNLGSHTDGTQLAKAADHVDTLKVSLRGMRRDGNTLTQMHNQLVAWQQAANTHHDSVEVEGVESAAELAMTQDLGITAVQGYYFSRPAMPGTRADLM
uniref:EAL domain-containing protein n=1 Tax=Lacticaseibacillus porcinae TaxID=1123687 RepID=UPI000F77CF8C